MPPRLAPHLDMVAIDPLSDSVDLAAWQALAKGASDANPFFGPQFLIPFVRHLGPRGLKLAVVFNRTLGNWLIAAPVGRRRIGQCVPAATVWATEYAPLGTPLMDRAAPPEAVDLFLKALTTIAGTPLVAVPYLPLDSTSAAQFLTVDRGWTWTLARQASRAAHDAGAKGEAQFAAAFSGKRRKELTRLMRRLEEQGEVSLTRISGPKAAGVFEQFLELEAAGWKGRSGTALACQAQTAAFARQMIATRAATDGVLIDRLTVSGRPVAMLVLLREAGRIFSWKIAFDETFARYSPGAQIALFAMKQNLADPDISGADSLAVPGHPMIGPLWRGTVDTATLLQARSPAGRALLKAGEVDVNLAQSARGFARKLLKPRR